MSLTSLIGQEISSLNIISRETTKWDLYYCVPFTNAALNDYEGELKIKNSDREFWLKFERILKTER